MKIVKLHGTKKKAIVTRDQEIDFRALFEREMKPEFWYAYATARKHLIHKPKKTIISELKRVQKEYTHHVREIQLSKLMKSLNVDPLDLGNLKL